MRKAPASRAEWAPLRPAQACLHAPLVALALLSLQRVHQAARLARQVPTVRVQRRLVLRARWVRFQLALVLKIVTHAILEGMPRHKVIQVVPSAALGTSVVLRRANARHVSWVNSRLHSASQVAHPVEWAHFQMQRPQTVAKAAHPAIFKGQRVKKIVSRAQRGNTPPKQACRPV